MLQITQEQKCIWRIGRYYISDAGDCEECKAFWEKLKNQKEQDIREMQGLLKKHMETGAEK